MQHLFIVLHKLQERVCTEKYELQIVPLLSGARVKRSSCGTLHGCWSVPSRCIANECTANARWSVSNGGSKLHLRLEALRQDLPTNAIYISLGFSEDRRMGKDTVLECVYNGVDRGKAFVSYNDGRHNAQLYQASAILIVNSSFAVNDVAFVCHMDVDFQKLIRLSDEDQTKVHDILARPYFLQFARGSADQYTYVKKKHPLSDGSLYPWTTKWMVSLLRNENGKYENIESAGQSVTGISRSATYTMVTIHAILMMWSWWFLLSNAILIARHFKTFWPSKQIAGVALWFQIHRGFALLSITLQTVAVVLVLVQSGFQLYLWCTIQCTMEHFTMPTHTWAGLIAYSLAVIQIVVALFRPEPNSSRRFYFNWFHCILAAAAFVIVSLGILSAVTLGKTALARYYGKWPNLLIGLYLYTFTLALIGLSFLDAYSARRVAEASEDTEDVQEYTKVSTSERSPERRSFQWIGKARLSILFLHAVISFIVCSTITTMILVNFTRSH